MLVIKQLFSIKGLVAGLTVVPVSACILALSLALLPGISSADSSDDREIENERDGDSDSEEDAPECIATRIDWDSVQGVPVVPVQEKLLYVGTINQGDEANPDMLLVIGADPGNPAEYGTIIHRLDMPKIGDELHHFGYNANRSKFIIPGLFSQRLHIVNLSDPKKPYIESVYDDLVEDSGYRDPHTVIGLPNGNNMITMLGADTVTTAPGGVIEVCGETGEYLRDFGPGAERNHAVVGPSYMYDAGFKPELNRMITTTFGWPRDIEGPINVPGLGDEISDPQVRTRYSLTRRQRHAEGSTS